VPEWLSAVIVRCLAKHPDDRFPSARAVLEALREGRGEHQELVSAPLRSAGPQEAAAQDETPTATMLRVRRPAGRRRILVALGLVAVVGALWASVRPGASLLVYNSLTEPVALTLGDSAFTLPAGDSLELPVRAGQPLEAHWAMVRPAGDDGRGLGDALEGTIAQDKVRGDLRRTIAPWADGISRLSPLVVNATTRPIRVSVVVKGQAIACGCSIRPGDSLHLGYYTLDRTTAVSAYDDSRDASARFLPGLVSIDSATGAATFRVVAESLHARPASATGSPRRGAKPAGPPERNPLGGFLPVR
jgi:hypothetical protein